VTCSDSLIQISGSEMAAMASKLVYCTELDVNKLKALNY